MYVSRGTESDAGFALGIGSFGFCSRVGERASGRPGEGVQRHGGGVNKPVVYQVEGMDRVRAHKDLVYKKDGAVELKMDIATPEKQKPGGAMAVVFFIHGGVPADVPVKPKDWGGFTGRGAGSSRRPG